MKDSVNLLYEYETLSLHSETSIKEVKKKLINYIVKSFFQIFE